MLFVRSTLFACIKRGLLAFMLVAFVPSALCQVAARLYYNKNWLLTKPDSAVYFRVAVIDTSNQVFAKEVKDYTKDGRLVMTGYFAGGKRNGVFTAYYPSGKTESEGSYTDDERSGVWRYYFSNGGLRYEARFEGKSTYVVEARDSSGNLIVKDGTGIWIEQYNEMGTNILMTVRGKFKDYAPDGIWTQTMPNGTVWSEEVFESGVFKRGYRVLEDNTRIELHSSYTEVLREPAKHRRTVQFAYTPITTTGDYPYIKRLNRKDNLGDIVSTVDVVYTIVEIQTGPVGGLSAFYKKLSSLIRYPRDARRLGIEGRVFVEFVVEKDGSFSSFQVIKGLGAGCDEEAVRALIESQKSVRWTPGVLQRRPVRQKYVLPVTFRLS